MKVVHQLALNGYVETIRGKNGGLRLGRDPIMINLGELIRSSEGDTGILPCLDTSDVCCIQPACKLMGILRQAQNALFDILSKYTLADLLKDNDSQRLLLLQPKPATSTI